MRTVRQAPFLSGAAERHTCQHEDFELASRTYSVVLVIDSAHVVELVLLGVELFEQEL